MGVLAAEALQHAHDHGVLHRDIKPGNLMLDAEGQLYITDFGLARIESDVGVTMTGDLVGTLRYMSPEQALGKRGVVDHRSDVYSLGVTLYELFTLRPPFDGADRQELLRQIAFEDAPKLRKINRSIPAELQTIVLKAIEKNPDQRYNTVAELADDLRAFLEDRPIEAKPPTSLQRAAKWSRRHSTLVRTAVVTLAIAVTIGGALLWNERSRTLAALTRETQEHQRAEAERRRASQLLYVSDMKLASDALRIGDVPRMVSLLDRHRPAEGEEDLRDFAWHYLDKSVHVQRNWMLELNSPVNGLQISPDGQSVCVAMQLGQIRVYGVSSGQLLRSFFSLSKINAVAWHPSGQSIISAGSDGYIRIWDVDTDSFGADKSKSDLSTGTILDRVAPRLSIAAHEGEANSVCVTPDSLTIVSCGDDGKIRTWDSATGEALAVLEGHQREVEQIAISADGTLLASASSDHSLVLWDLSTEAQTMSWTSPSVSRMVSVAFSTDGSHLAGGDIYGSLLVVEVETGIMATVLQLDGIESVRFVGNSHRIVTGDRGGALHVWNALAQRQGQEPLKPTAISQWAGHLGRVQGLATVPGGQTILSGSRDGSIASWSPQFDSTNWACSLGQDFALGNDNSILACDHEVYQYDLDKRLLTSAMNPNRAAWKVIASAKASPRIATADAQGTVTVYNWQRRVEIARWKVEHEPHRIAISADGHYVAVANWDLRDHVEVFDVRNPSKPRIIAARQCACVEFSPEGRLLAVGSMDDLLLYDLHEGGPPIRLVGHDSSLNDAAFSPDGKKIASVSDDRRLKLWDVVTERAVHSIEAHRQDVCSVDFSDDGSLLATGGRDATVRIWHAQTLQPMLEVETQDAVEHVQFASQDRRVIARLGNGEIHVFDSLPQLITTSTDSLAVAPASLIGLGQIPDADSYTIKDVSDDGQLIVGDFETDHEYRSFHWSRTEGMVVLPLPEGYRRSRVYDIGNDGKEILGRFHILINTAHIGRWLSSDQSPVIEPWSKSWKYITPYDMLGSRIAGGIREDAETTRAFYFDGSQLVELSGVADELSSIAKTVANNGSLVTGVAWRGGRNARSRSSREMRVVQWRDGKAHFLPGFGEESYNWLARDTSADGSVVVGYRWSEDAYAERIAFRWEADKVELLGDLPRDPVHSEAEGISADGRIVVGNCKSGSGRTAFVWDAAHGMRSLKRVLQQHCVDVTLWQLQYAVAASADGTHIAGQGIDPHGRPQAFLARLPRAAFGAE